MLGKSKMAANKISMSPIPVVELDFCVYCKVFSGEDRVSWWLQVMVSILRSFLSSVIQKISIIFSRVTFIIDVL